MSETGESPNPTELIDQTISLLDVSKKLMANSPKVAKSLLAQGENKFIEAYDSSGRNEDLENLRVYHHSPDWRTVTIYLGPKPKSEKVDHAWRETYDYPYVMFTFVPNGQEWELTKCLIGKPSNIRNNDNGKAASTRSILDQHLESGSVEPWLEDTKIATADFDRLLGSLM